MMNSEIADLICSILDDEEYDEALKLGFLYSNEEGDLPVERFLELDNRIGIQLPTHTRYPIEYRSIIRSIKFYCDYEIKVGIRFPRNFVSNVSAHLEGCAKLLLEKMAPRRYHTAPLGPVLYTLAQFSVPRDLIEKALAFNNLIYVKAKHDWNIPEDEHLFDRLDAIMIYFSARKLAKQLLDVKGIKIPMEEVRKDNARILTRDELPPAPAFKPLSRDEQRDLDQGL